jgi:hypothetical protein
MSGGENFLRNPGVLRCGNVEVCLAVIATRWLAMTALTMTAGPTAESHPHPSSDKMPLDRAAGLR